MPDALAYLLLAAGWLAFAWAAWDDHRFARRIERLRNPRENGHA